MPLESTPCLIRKQCETMFGCSFAWGAPSHYKISSSAIVSRGQTYGGVPSPGKSGPATQHRRCSLTLYKLSHVAILELARNSRLSIDLFRTPVHLLFSCSTHTVTSPSGKQQYTKTGGIDFYCHIMVNFSHTSLQFLSLQFCVDV